MTVQCHDTTDVQGRREYLLEFLRKLEKPWTEERIESYIRARGYCEYCGADVLSSPEAFWGSDWDHILPKKHGGEKSDFDANIAVACRKCNELKGAQLPEDVTSEQMKKMKRRARIETVRPMVADWRQRERFIETHSAFRELVEMKRCQNRSGIA